MDVEAFIGGIRATESGSTSGNYTAENERTGAFGAYQFLPKYWADFLRQAKRAGLATQDESWPPGKEAQDTVFRGMVEYYAEKYDRNWALIAVAWHCGPGCAEDAVKAHGTGATPNQINSAVAAARGGSHSNEIAYIRNVYTKSGSSFDPDAPGGDPDAAGGQPDAEASMAFLPIRKGMGIDDEVARRADVAWFQNRLNRAGVGIVEGYQRLTPDGRWGPETSAMKKLVLGGNPDLVNGNQWSKLETMGPDRT